MKNETAAGLVLSPVQETISSSPARLAERSFAAGLVYAGSLGVMCAAFGWTPLWAAVGAGMAALLAAVWCAAGRGWRQWIPAAAALLLAGWCLLAPQARDSAAGLANGVLAYLQQLTGIIRLPLEQQGSAAIRAALPACVVWGALLGSLSVYVPGAGAVLAVSGVALAATGTQSGGLWPAVLCLGAAVLCLGNRRSCRTAPAVALHGAILLTLAAVLTAVGLALAGLSGIDPGEAGDAIRQDIHAMCWEDARQPMPEGRLTGEAPAFTDTEMLRVTLSQPESLYLRGFVGQRYTRTGWEALSAAELADQAEEVYWLQSGGFLGATQLSRLAALLDVDTPQLDVQVEVSGACRRCAILPYELADSSLCDARQLRDTLPDGGRQYDFTATGNLTARVYELLELLSQRLDDPAMQEYLAQERVYRAQVYDNYLTLPEDTRGVLCDFLGDAPDSITSYEAKSRILECLAETVSYDGEPVELPEDADPVSSFLQETGRGSAVQYATAAVMMLRYYGIPARYVEGYLITPEAVSGQSGAVTLTLTGNDAHAWAEYYEDGVGWVPFETTPPYIGVMAESQWRWFQPDETAQLTGAQGQEGGSARNNTLRHSKVEPLEHAAEAPQVLTIWKDLAATVSGTLTTLWTSGWLPLILLLLLLTAVTLALLRRRTARRRRTAAFEHPDAACGTAALFAYAMELMWRSGLDRRNCPVSDMAAEVEAWVGKPVAFTSLARLNDEARYSCHGISEAQRGQMRQFADETLQSYRRRLKPWQKLREKWIRCMY